MGMMGGSVMGGSSKMAQSAQIREFLNMVKKHGVQEIDTARIYNRGRSEELLGEVHASHDFAISTKAPAFSPGSLSEAKIKDSCLASLKALQQDKVDIYYLHGPDRQTPLEEQCKAINDLFQEGRFSRFGVSNLRVDEVKKIHEICQREHYVLPSVYQGGFNPIGRGAEIPLFPTLRELGIAFYAFSPLGGGFFSRPIDELQNPVKGSRYDAMKAFKDIYVNDTSVKALASLTDICKNEGIQVKEATIRWFMHHSPLSRSDGVILGASSIQQAEENLKACEGGLLPHDIVSSFENMWALFKANPPPYHA